MPTNEAFSRVANDAQLADQGWNTQDPNSVRYEYVLPDGRADYVLCDRYGHSMAVIEAKRYSVNPAEASAQAMAYAKQVGAPYIFLSNGKEVRFWEWEREAFDRPVKTFFKQDDL
jgi:type I restriction enzyme, R subunit